MKLAAAQSTIRDTTSESVTSSAAYCVLLTLRCHFVLMMPTSLTSWYSDLASLSGVSLPLLDLGWLLWRFGIDAWHNAFGGTTSFIRHDFGQYVSCV